MKYLIKSLSLCSALIITCLLFTSNQATAQANITPDEFTAKGVSVWSEGSPAPNPKFNDLFNKKYKLHDLLDKPTIVEIIPKDCNGCDRNLKYLKSFYKQFDINIITINESIYRDKLIANARTGGVQWSVVQDDSAKFGQATMSQQAKVSFLLITPDKRIYKVYKSPKEIGKLGVDLQTYFKNK